MWMGMGMERDGINPAFVECRCGGRDGDGSDMYVCLIVADVC